MNKTIMIKIILLVAVVITVLQCIHVAGAYKEEGIMDSHNGGRIAAEKIQRIPEPQLRAL